MLKWLLGILLAPAACGAVLAAMHTLGDVASHTRLTLPFIAGFAGYALVHFYWVQPVRLYVVGHELSHALAAWMSGAKIFNFAVGKKGGHVDLSHSNAFIALAPYVFPFYAMVVIFAYRLTLWLSPLSGTHGRWAYVTFLAAMGTALSFHLIHTIEALWGRHQSDLDQAGGIAFSLIVIALLNCVVLIAALKCLFPTVVSMEHGLRTIWGVSKGFWANGATLLLRLYSK